jgi:predicted AlkP superfamily pyrophosphatase or phosphodiesterase
MFSRSLFFTVLALLTNEVLTGNPQASRHPKVLMISYDGFRHSYFKEHGPTPTFSELMNNGAYVREMKNVFPTKTFPNHISLVTGLYPGVHGGLSNSIYDRDKQEVVNMFAGGEDYISRNPGVLPLWVSVNETGCIMLLFLWVKSR